MKCIQIITKIISSGISLPFKSGGGLGTRTLNSLTCDSFQDCSRVQLGRPPLIYKRCNYYHCDRNTNTKFSQSIKEVCSSIPKVLPCWASDAAHCFYDAFFTRIPNLHEVTNNKGIHQPVWDLLVVD